MLCMRRYKTMQTDYSTYEQQILFTILFKLKTSGSSALLDRSVALRKVSKYFKAQSVGK